VKQADVDLYGHRLIVIDSPVKHAFTFTPSVCPGAEVDDRLLRMRAKRFSLIKTCRHLSPLDVVRFAAGTLRLRDRSRVRPKVGLRTRLSRIALLRPVVCLGFPSTDSRL